MRSRTPKRAALDRQAADPRREARDSYGRCMICECSPENPDRELPPEQSRLAIHEISCGSTRLISLDKPYCWLCLCWYCNTHVVTSKRRWPPVRQLALQKWRASVWHDLPAYVALIHPNAPNAITAQEVEDEMAEIISELTHGSY